MIPALDARGLLPDGVHSCDEEDLRVRFGRGEGRRRILDGFLRMRREAEALGLAGIQWVDGSFVTAKAKPGDLDVVTFCDYDLLNRLGKPIQAFYVVALSGGKDSIPTYGCDTYAVPACDAGHPYFGVFDRWRKYWRRYFSLVYDESGRQIVAEDKGFVSLQFGDSAQLPAVATTR